MKLQIDKRDNMIYNIMTVKYERSRLVERLQRNVKVYLNYRLIIRYTLGGFLSSPLPSKGREGNKWKRLGIEIYGWP